MSSNRKRNAKESVAADEWISQAAAARMRGISRQGVSDLIGRGRLRTLVIAGKVLVRRADVEAFQAKRPGPAPKEKKSKPSRRD